MKLRKINRIDRKAWLRIVEAFLAILIIFGVVLIILSRQGQRADISDDVYEKQRQILNVISKNNSLRTEIISENNVKIDNPKINAAISNMVPSSWNFATNICGLDDICSNPGIYENKDIFATEVIVTSNLTDYSPQKLRFFVWAK